MLLECAGALWVARWRVRRWTFSRLAATLGRPGAPPPAADPACPQQAVVLPQAQAAVEDLRWALAVWTKVLPSRLTCLMQAVAAHRVLKRRGIACEIYFGVTGSSGVSSAGAAISAHAWLACAGDIITGAAEARQFRPVAVYRFAPLEDAEAA